MGDLEPLAAPIRVALPTIEQAMKMVHITPSREFVELKELVDAGTIAKMSAAGQVAPTVARAKAELQRSRDDLRVLAGKVPSAWESHPAELDALFAKLGRNHETLQAQCDQFEKVTSDLEAAAIACFLGVGSAIALALALLRMAYLSLVASETLVGVLAAVAMVSAAVIEVVLEINWAIGLYEKAAREVTTGVSICTQAVGQVSWSAPAPSNIRAAAAGGR